MQGSSRPRAAGSAISSGERPRPDIASRRSPALAEPAARGVLAVDRDEPLEEGGHLISAVVQPRSHQRELLLAHAGSLSPYGPAVAARFRPMPKAAEVI